jgi:hypothetical protein
MDLAEVTVRLPRQRPRFLLWADVSGSDHA